VDVAAQVFLAWRRGADRGQYQIKTTSVPRTPAGQDSRVCDCICIWVVGLSLLAPSPRRHSPDAELRSCIMGCAARALIRPSAREEGRLGCTTEPTEQGASIDWGRWAYSTWYGTWGRSPTPTPPQCLPIPLVVWYRTVYRIYPYNIVILHSPYYYRLVYPSPHTVGSASTNFFKKYLKVWRTNYYFFNKEKLCA
jgi:hypothetical protein